MNTILSESVFFGVCISILGYEAGVVLKKKTGLSVFNPLLVGIILVILFLKVFRIDYDDYYKSARYLSYFLTPATISLAIPLYRQISLLKEHLWAILGGIFSGAATSLISVLLLSRLFHLTHEQYVTILPKSITTAIGMGVSDKLGGIVTITVMTIIVTGIFGSLIAEAVFKLLRIYEPVAKGIALGTSSHAVGTTKAMELGEIEGAMSSLSIVAAGLITVVGAALFAEFF